MSRVLIVSDDALMQKELLAVLSSELWMMLPECQDGASAIREVDRVRPQLVVVDAELRDRDGLDLAAELKRVYDPAIIVVSRDSSLAARAFDIGVVDFVVAPIRPDRFGQAIERALGHRPRPLPVPQNGAASGSKLRVKSKGGFIFLKYEELVWVEAAGNYLNLHCTDRVYRIREPLSEFNQRLDGTAFVRIHRSIIVNTGYIRELRSWGMGDYVIVLKNAKELPVSRSYRGSLDQWMRNGEFNVGTDGESALVDESGDEPTFNGYDPRTQAS